MERKLNLSCFTDFPIIKTDRITMRQILKEDAERIFEMRANPRTNRFIFRPEMEEPKNAVELVAKVEEGYRNKSVLAWAGILRDGNRIIGTCGFNSISHQNLRAEIGGELLVDYWGKNIALEAVNGIIEYGFNQLGLNTIEAKVNPDNKGAVHILDLLGFEREAFFKQYGYYDGIFRDLAVYTKFNNTKND